MNCSNPTKCQAQTRETLLQRAFTDDSSSALPPSQTPNVQVSKRSTSQSLSLLVRAASCTVKLAMLP